MLAMAAIALCRTADFMSHPADAPELAIGADSGCRRGQAAPDRSGGLTRTCTGPGTYGDLAESLVQSACG